MEPVTPAPNPFYGVLVVKGIAAVTAVLDAVRCVVDSVEAKKVARDLGLDFAADAGEVILMYLRLTLSNPSGEPGVIIAGGFERYTKDFSRNKTITQSIAAIRYGIVYGTWAYINALELLNGLAEPNTGTAFTPDNGQSKFDSIYDILTHADADRSQWSGTGAQNYSDINRDLMELVQRTAAADTATAHTVQLQADQVKQLRNEIAEIKIILIGLLVLIMAFLGPLNFFAAKANAFPMDDSAEDFTKPRWSQGVEKITQVSEPWLPFIVLLPCISATITASVLFGLLITDRNSTAADLQDPNQEYQDVADQANKIRASMQLAPSVGALTAPTSHAPSFANAFRLPGATASAKASTTPLSKTRSFADTFLTSRASATTKAPTASAAKTSTTAEEPTITTNVDDVATTTAYADVIPAEVAAGRSSAQPTAHQEHS